MSYTDWLFKWFYVNDMRTAVLAKELTCVGKGDSECSWITRTQKEWESDMQEELHFYHETPIMEELEYTYEQLLEQQKFVTQLSDFQKKLTEEISNGSNLQTIANMVYDIISNSHFD